MKKARQLLIANPEWCKEQLSHGETPVAKHGREQGCSIGEHGSLNCVLAFLGEENWSRALIANPEWCKAALSHGETDQNKNPKDHGDKLHEHGSLNCVLASAPAETFERLITSSV